jgi:hypothetical protein
VGFSNDNFHSLGVSSSAPNFTSSKPLGSLPAFPPQPAQPGQPQQLSGNQRMQAEKLRQSKFEGMFLLKGEQLGCFSQVEILKYKVWRHHKG